MPDSLLAPADARTESLINAGDGGASKRRSGSVFCDGGFWTAVLTIANAALGAGLLSVPYASIWTIIKIDPFSISVKFIFRVRTTSCNPLYAPCPAPDHDICAFRPSSPP